MKPIHAKPSLYAFYFDVIKEIGLEYGYNIVLHGSMNRDLDLIAIPWQEQIGDKTEMLNKIAEAIGGQILFELDEDRKGFSEKFHGRQSYVVNINRTIKAKYQGMITEFEEHADPQYYIDISVLPVGKQKNTTINVNHLIDKVVVVTSSPNASHLEIQEQLVTAIKKAVDDAEES